MNTVGITIGDTVRLNSGSPDMRVTEIAEMPNGNGVRPAILVTAEWASEFGRQKMSANAKCFTKVSIYKMLYREDWTDEEHKANRRYGNGCSSGESVTPNLA